jgi:hypothetical protein
MAIKYLSGKRMQGTAAERTALNLTSPPQTSWKELGRTTLTSAGDAIDVRGTSVTRNVGTFDGSNDYITFATKFDQMQQAGSFSVWIKPANIGSTGNDIIFDNSDVSSANNGFSIRHSDPSGSKTVVLFGIWGSTDGSITTSNIWTGDEWQHLVVTYDGTTAKIYRNGTLVKSGALTANSSAGSYNARIGWGANGNDHKFDGKMTQALVYNDALTQSEVTTLYNSGTPIASPSTSGLVTKLDLTADTNDSQGSNNGTNTGVAFGSDTITGNFTAKDNLMILQHGIPSGNISSRLRFNSDTGSNYAQRGSRNGGSYATGTSRDNVSFSLNPGNASDEWLIATVTNKADKEKLWISHGIDGTSGANQDPNRSEIIGKWANTSDSITSVNVYHSEGGDYATGSECVVLGCDNDEADSGTNFWQELASSSTVSSNAIEVSFTAKKYLWVQGSFKQGSGTGGSMRFRVGNSSVDTGSNYAERNSEDGASDGTTTSQTELKTCVTDGSGGVNVNGYFNLFIINKSDKEKLFIGGNVTDLATTGAGTAPRRIENVGKWANTSAQINILKLYRTADTLDSGSLKVWGAD